MSNLPYISPELVTNYKTQIETSASPATAKRKVASLRKFFNWAHEAGHIEKNPMPKTTPQKIVSNELKTITKPPSSKRTSKYLTVTNLVRILFGLGLTFTTFAILSLLKVPIPFIFSPASENRNLVTINDSVETEVAPSLLPSIVPSLIPSPTPTQTPSNAVMEPTTPLTQETKEDEVELTNPAFGGLIEAEVLTLSTTDLSDGDISVNPDGSGNLNLIFEGNAGNNINATNANLNSGSLYYGYVGNNSTSYNLVLLQSGSNQTTRFSVDALGNTKIAGNLNEVHDISLMGNLTVNGKVLLTQSGKLNFITGYYQESGLFDINQGAPDYGLIHKTLTDQTGKATREVLKIELDESQLADGSSEDSLIVSRKNAKSDGYAIYVSEGNVKFEGDLGVSQSLSVNNLAVNNNLTLSGNSNITGQGVFTFSPTEAHTGTWALGSPTWNADDASIYVNPASATADSNLFALAVGGSVVFDVDAEGDIYARNLILTGSTSVGTTTVAGDLTVEGNTTLGDASSDLLTFTASVAQDSDLIPFTTTGTNDLGSSSLPWDNLYIGTSTTVSDDSFIGLGSGAALIEFDDQATDEVNILNANVGIGISTPTYRFQVSDASTGVGGFRLCNGGYGCITSSQTGIGAGGSLTIGSFDSITLDARAETWPIYVRGQIQSNNNTNLRIQPQTNFNLLLAPDSGNVGIGTTDPATFDLQVAGSVGPNANDGGSLGSAALGWSDLYLANAGIIGAGNGNSSITMSTNVTFLGWSGSVNKGFTLNPALATLHPGDNDQLSLGTSGLAWSDLFIASGGIINFDAGDITITHNTDSLAIEGGNLGIGISTPVGKLDVSGAVTGKALAIFNETGDQNIFVASASGIGKFVITNSGNIGVGTSIPEATLHLNVPAISGGETGFRHTVSDANGFITIGNGDGSDGRYGPSYTNYITGNSFTKTNFINMIEASNDTGSEPVLTIDSRRNSASLTTRPLLSISNYNTSLITVGATGYLGIGDTEPDYLLELHDATNTPTLALSDDDIAHGVTTLAQTDVFYHLSSLSTTDGGALLTAFADNVNTAGALEVRGVLGNTPDDTVPAIKFSGSKGSGTGVVDLETTETVFQIANNDNAASFTVEGDGDVVIVGSATTCTIGNGTGATNCSSDERLKENITNLDIGLDEILALRPVNYNWKDKTKPQTKNVGLIAQEVIAVIPQAVGEVRDGYLGIDYASLVVPLIKSVQELNAKTSEASKFITENVVDGALVVDEFTTKTLVAESGEFVNFASENIQVGSLIAREATVNGTLKVANIFTNSIIANVVKAGDLVAGNIVAGIVQAEEIGVEGLLTTTDFIATNIQAGAVATKEFTTDSATAFTASIDNLLVTSGLVSPNVKTSKIESINESEEITIAANVKVEGQTTTKTLAVENDATVAGTFYADKIVANTLPENPKITEIEKLLKEVEGNQKFLYEIAEKTNLSVESVEGGLLSNLSVAELYVTGQTAVNNLSVSRSISFSDLVIQSSSNESPVSSVDSLIAPLSLQSLALAPIELMAGRIKIDTSGNAEFLGNVNIAGNLNVEGQSRFGTLITDKLIIASQGVAAKTSPEDKALGLQTVVETNASAGEATISTGESEIIINNPSVSDNTLVYVTPTSETNNQVLFVKSKEVGSFIVGFINPTETEVSFNWWIIDVQQ